MTVDNIDPPDPAEAHRQLTAQVNELRVQLDAALADKATTSTELSELRRQLDTAQRELGELRAQPAPAPTRRESSIFEDDEE